jgi:hypothetical protein
MPQHFTASPTRKILLTTSCVFFQALTPWAVGWLLPTMGVGETNHFLRTGGNHARSKEGVQEEGRCKEGRQEGSKEGDCKKGCKEEEVTSRTLFGARRPRRAFFVPDAFSIA